MVLAFVILAYTCYFVAVALLIFAITRPEMETNRTALVVGSGFTSGGVAVVFSLISLALARYS